MDPSKPTLDLEKELTCSICTELLYQPLTLLDCLHTFCGACLRDWFAFQEIQAENAPAAQNLDEDGTLKTFTCPSCRAPVRDTRHNATVATLLDMYISANPDKARPDDEKEALEQKYKPGDQVIPRHQAPEPTPEARRLEEEDRRLIEEVREMSLREAGVGSSSAATSLAPRQRRRVDSRSGEGQLRGGRDSSRESGNGHQRHDRARRRPGDEARYTADHPLQADSRAGGDQRRRRSRSRQSTDASNAMRRRQVEHQSSLRSLISSDDLEERDIEREIEDFARQIQEEGLLDGLDLDNIDLTNNDELSRRITEAYRRRQRDRTRAEPTRRSNTSVVSRQSSDLPPEPTSAPPPPPFSSETRRPGSRQRPHSRSASATSYSDDRSRPPPALNNVHLDVRERRRRRNSSGARSATLPAPAPPPETRPAARSQTDLSLRSHSNDPPLIPRPLFGEGRSSSALSVPNNNSNPQQTTTSSSTSRDQSFASRLPDPSALVSSSLSSPTASNAAPPLQRANRPADLTVLSQATSQATSTSPSTGSPTSPGHPRQRTQLYPEPFITCSRCQKQHIEYEVHYNCSICSSGNWNLCLDCYRTGKGCQHWFGFGYGAWDKWEKARSQAGGGGGGGGGKDLPPPHMLTANRYLPPKITPGGAEGRRTLTTEDPLKRLESGNFCASCLAWANECYWRCNLCNQGDWGFCNDCVNQGKSCTHPLLPLTYQPQASSFPGRSPSPSPSHSSSSTPPPSPTPSPRLPQPPTAASVLTGPNVPSIGPFKPLTFTTRCDVCQDPIPPSQSRLHCYSCTSSIEPDTKPGDYDVCSSCYASFVARREISFENGTSGWRRCPQQGHRMVVIGFQEGPGGQFRRVVADLVGGRKLDVEGLSGSVDSSGDDLEKWSWHDGEKKLVRLVTKDVAATAPKSLRGEGGDQTSSTTFTDSFPPDGGAGMRVLATWAWYPQAEDELMFPKGAEVREVEDVNSDWFYGAYMGARGLFPSPYVRRLGD